MKIFYKVLPFVIIIIFLSSCSESPKKEKVEINLDSLIYDDNGKLFTGTMKGTVRGKSLEYDVVNGVKHGSFKIYNENNILEIEGFIKENKNDSLWKYYYPDGTLESQGYFENDLIDGNWIWYYPSGKVRETSEYKNGLRDGKLIMFSEEGEIISETLFENGVEVKSE